MDFDFESIKNRITTALSSKASWAQILPFSTNTRLIDAIAEEINNLAHYDEYLTRETKWALAQNKSSLLSAVKFLGYNPHRKIGAVGTVRFSTDENFANPPVVVVSLPKYTIFSNEDGTVKVCTIVNESLLLANNYIDLDVVQGTPKEFSTTAVGDLYEEIEVDNDSIENVYYELYVNDVLWEELDDIRLADEGDSLVYEIENKSDGTGIILKFGNNIFGKKLENGDEILFKYVETLGAGGNITSTGIITEIESVIYDIGGVRVEGYVTNLVSINGGNGDETIEEIRTTAPNSFQAGDRATNKNDYIAILLQNSLVSKALVWGEYEYNEDEGNPPGTFVSLEENVIHIVAVSPTYEELTPAEQNTIIEYINDFKAPTAIMNFEDVIFIYLSFDIDAYVSDRSYTLSEVKSNILTEISTEYGIANMNFFDNIYESDFKGFIDLIDGVDYHDTILSLYVEGVFNSPYEATIAIPLYEIDTETIEVYVKNDVLSMDWTLIGTDDGAGGFIAEAGYDLTGSSVNYLTGEGTLIVVAGLAGLYSDYEIKYYFKLVDNNIELNNRAQILRYAESDIDVSYI